MAKVHIVQLLCESRHCLFGTVYEEGMCTNLQAVEFLKDQMRRLNANPWCGICGSHNLNFEDGVTKFDSMEEATPFIEAEQEKNAITRYLFGKY